MPVVLSEPYSAKGKTYTATIYADGPGAHYEKNPQSYTIKTIKVNSKTKLDQKLAPGGGAAISIKEEVKK